MIFSNMKKHGNIIGVFFIVTLFFHLVFVFLKVIVLILFAVMIIFLINLLIFIHFGVPVSSIKVAEQKNYSILQINRN